MAEWLFGLLLRAYPEALRHRKGREMWSTFEAHLEEARCAGRLAVTALWAREVAAALRAGLRRLIPSAPSGLTGDLKLATRSIVRAPGFSLVVIGTLAIGVGANTAVLSVVNGVLLRPLPYPESDRLVTLIGRFLPESGFDFAEFPLSEPEWLDVSEQSDSLVDVAAYTSDFGVNVTGDDDPPERLLAASVSRELFRTLRLVPLVGRTFNPEEDLPSSPNVVVIGRDLWERRYGSNPTLIGKTIEINGREQEVIGVVEAGRFFPSPGVELYFPLGVDRARDRTARGGHYLYVVARYAPGVSFEGASSELSVLMDRWKREYPDTHTGHFLFLKPLLDDIVGSVRPALLVLMAAVFGLLLVACANVGNLFLARSEERWKDAALRTALGAGRLRLFQQSLAESGVLFLTGGLLGIVFARLGIASLLAVDPEVIPPGRSAAIDAGVLLASLSVVAVASLVVAMLPLLASRPSSFREALRATSRSGSRSRRGVRFRRVLVVAEIAGSLVLVIAAGLLVRSLANLLGEDPGFRAESVLTAQLSLPRASYPEPSAATAFIAELVAEARRLPGVREAASASDLPLADSAPNNDIAVEGRPEPLPGEPKPAGSMLVASEGYFELLDIPLVRGRLFEAADREGAQPVAVISRTMAASFWPDEDPVGQRFNPLFGEEPLLTIVGIVGDVKYQNLGDPPRAAWYFPLRQSSRVADWAGRSQRILLRVDGDPRAVVASLRALIRSKDPNLVLSEVRTMEDVTRRSVASSRFTASLLTAFAAVATALGATGVFALIAFSVTRRRKELGIRAALGATQVRLVALVAREGVSLCACGVALGMAVAFLATSGLESLLHGVSPTDPSTFLTVALGAAFVALAASYLPARRVATIEPVETLRAE